jgi:hypothetical protein
MSGQSPVDVKQLDKELNDLPNYSSLEDLALEDGYTDIGYDGCGNMPLPKISSRGEVFDVQVASAGKPELCLCPPTELVFTTSGGSLGSIIGSDGSAFVNPS